MLPKWVRKITTKKIVSKDLIVFIDSNGLIGGSAEPIYQITIRHKITDTLNLNGKSVFWPESAQWRKEQEESTIDWHNFQNFIK